MPRTLFVLALCLAGCVPPQPPPANTPPPAGAAHEALPARFTGTAGIVEVPGSGRPVRLEALETGRHPHFDRLVFRFRDGLPGYHLEYIDRPVRDCGSGEVVPLPGDGWLEIRMSPAQAHTDEGRPTAAPRQQAADLPVVLELRRTCDFEGIVTYVAALRSPNRYRVVTLEDPPRVVVDIRH